MKKLLFFLSMVNAVEGYTLKFYNKTDYPLQAVIFFDPGAQCKKITLAIPPQLPHELPVTIDLECCTESIRITNMSPEILNRISYDYQQTRTDEGTCGDTAITISRRSDNILEIR